VKKLSDVGCEQNVTSGSRSTVWRPGHFRTTIDRRSNNGNKAKGRLEKSEADLCGFGKKCGPASMLSNILISFIQKM